MKFVNNGPYIPAELIAAQERGEVLFLCGAGVSMTVGLPSFRQLAENTYKALNETWVDHPAEASIMDADGAYAGQYDRAIRSLERRITLDGGLAAERQRLKLRSCITEQLKVTGRVNLDNHTALLTLSRNAFGQTRIVTTNFDTLFERAWLKHFADFPPSHSGSAMPQPGSPLFNGIFHLHGRISDNHKSLKLNETDIILSSSEFGEAYLRSGWAARYVYDLARTNIVVIVGYSAEDPPMRYLLEVLDADRSRFPDLRDIYAFAELNDKDPQGEIWNAKGIKPIIYEQRGTGDHSGCYDTLQEWKRYSDNPSHWRGKKLSKVIARDPSATNEVSV
ncbi:MAG: SIR2 family protein, partial [Pseudomonadota bacterium]